MKKTMLLSVAVCAVYSMACAIPGVPAPYTNISSPMQAMEKKIGPKKGEACSKNYLGLVEIGDGGIAAAAKAGGIRDVTSVDVSYTNILGLYQEHCAVVTGE